MDNNFFLDKSILEQIFFCMEDQGLDYFLDIRSRTLCSSNELPSPIHEDIIPIPNWKPVDGYNLMESFVARLNNPLARADLLASLQAGKGVFREFKNTLKNYSEVERRWFAYRERQMRKKVLHWFNAIRESRGLESLKDEDEGAETDDLVSSDFNIRIVSNAEDLKTIAEKDKHAFEELFPHPANAEYWYFLRRNYMPGPDDREQGSRVFGAYNPLEELCAFLWILLDDASLSRKIVRVVQLYVEPLYRGLGVADTLLNACHQYCEKEEIGSIIFENCNAALDNLLKRQGFSECARTYSKGSISDSQ